MAYRISSFQFDADGSFSTGISTATVNYSTDQLQIDNGPFAMIDVPNICQAISELIAQPGDGTTFTQNTTAGGTIVVWDPAAQTIKVGILAAWAKLKAEAFVASVAAYL